jgi:tRNA-splicing ligase RtcB
MYARVPTGVGANRRDLRLSRQDLRGVLEDGARWAIERGFGHSGEALNGETRVTGPTSYNRRAA